MLCLLLYSAWHKSDGYQLISLSRSAVLGFKVRLPRSVIVSQIQKFIQQCKGILPFCITAIHRRKWAFWEFLWNTETSTGVFVQLIYLNCHPTGFSGEMVNNPVLGKPPAFLYCHAGVGNLNRKCLAFPMKCECHILKFGSVWCKQFIFVREWLGRKGSTRLRFFAWSVFTVDDFSFY